MCGIAGIVNYQSHKAADREVIETMLQAMVHRGPDDGGCYLDRYVGLGHRRLSIIDRSGGHQPMCNEDGTVWIRLVNGAGRLHWIIWATSKEWARNKIWSTNWIWVE